MYDLKNIYKNRKNGYYYFFVNIVTFAADSLIICQCLKSL